MQACPADTAAPDRRTRVLVVDDDETTLDFVRTCLETGSPGVQVVTYNSQLFGRPGPDFNWAAHDLLVLDYNLGNGETGVDWLEDHAVSPGFPRTILLTAERSAAVVGNAVRWGAEAYLNKSGLDPDVLVDTIKSLLDTPAEPADRPGSPVAAAPPAAVPAGPVLPEPAGDGVKPLVSVPGGSYRFIREIGRGAMSQVFLAERSEDSTTVVLKLLERDVARDRENVQRFAREGELLSGIDSPYVVKIFDHGMTNSYGYIAMEFFGRGDLAQKMARGVTPGEAVLYLHNIACGLEAVHQAGIVHRDLKPGNVMFRGDGSMALVDFGLSKPLDTDVNLTSTGVILGTPFCMSPEQTTGQEADHRSDLYAAGVMFYEMLTGQKPYMASSLPSLMLTIQSAPVPRLPHDLTKFQPVVDRLLAKNPDDRYQSAGELTAVLAELAVDA